MRHLSLQHRGWLILEDSPWLCLKMFQFLQYCYTPDIYIITHHMYIMCTYQKRCYERWKVKGVITFYNKYLEKLQKGPKKIYQLLERISKKSYSKRFLKIMTILVISRKTLMGSYITKDGDIELSSLPEKNSILFFLLEVLRNFSEDTSFFVCLLSFII